jgi:hypothetical protein
VSVGWELRQAAIAAGQEPVHTDPQNLGDELAKLAVSHAYPVIVRGIRDYLRQRGDTDGVRLIEHHFMPADPGGARDLHTHTEADAAAWERNHHG